MRAEADNSNLRDRGADTVGGPIVSRPMLKAPVLTFMNTKGDWLLALTVSAYAHIYMSLYFHW